MKIPLCDTAQLSNCRGFELELDGKALSGFIIRDGAQIRAYQNRCPHIGIELNWLADQFLDLQGEHIICATHGALFRLYDGHCIAGPCVGQALQPISTLVEDGHIYLHLPEHL
ncbi:MAG: Rieske 2Fe-2S domain-containing protein [Gammaproteobacteria bacterium]|nr:Rieske 2Fe-2S domain-containing protein [Gammaproteobacteria bacterium]